jgi:hypothetical protein
MDMSQLKTQIMTMFMMKSSSTPGKGGGNEIYNILYSMIMLSAVEWVFKQAPAFFLAVKAYLMARYAPKKEAWLPLANKSKKETEQINSVTMMRVFSTSVGTSAAKSAPDNVYVEKVDAVIDYICSIDNARHVRMDVRCTLNNTEEIELTPLLKAKVKQSTVGEAEMVELVLFSSVLKISDIRNWIDDVHSNYIAEKNNKLGNKTYYFNEVVQEPVVQMDMSAPIPKKSYRWDNMPKMLAFNMSEFKTSKSFSNVYGDHVNELKERLDLFVSHPEWYMERGIPHSLGIMLHGVPGAGKTSTIKAIAKDTNRHIFNLSLRPFTTQRQLTNLFFNETVSIHTYDGGKQTLKIPLNRRVYVIEDIDCLTDVVLDRALKAASAEQPAQQQEGDAVTLSFLLNLLDGVLETPGRILIITSNYPDKLDKALVRPGRIDVKIEFKNATRAFILDMINKFYSIAMTLDEIPDELEGVFTPAEVMESLCCYFKSPSQALLHMVNKRQSKKLLEVQEKTGTLLTDLVQPTSEALAEAPVAPVEEKIVEPEENKVVMSITEEQDLPNPYGKSYYQEQRDHDIGSKIPGGPSGFNGFTSAYSLLGDGEEKTYDSVFDSPLFQDAVPPPGVGENTLEYTLQRLRSNKQYISSKNLND